MSAASPTPIGAGSHISSLGRRTSARQALRRPPSRPQLSRSESNPVPSSKEAKGAGAKSQQYSTLNDSSDDEIPVPMKLSALTKALLDDGGAPASASEGINAVSTAHRPSSPPARPESRVMTRRRSVLTRSTSSAADEREKPAKEPVRETRRHARAGSAHISSSRPASPVRTRDSSPPPRKRVVRLSTTPGGGVLQNPVRRSLSASTSRKRPESGDRVDEKDEIVNQSAAAIVANSEADLNTPAQAVRRVQIAVGSSGSKMRSAGSSGPSSKRSGSIPPSDHDVPEDPQTIARGQAAVNQGSVSRFGGSVRAREDPNLQSSMRIKRVGKVAGSFLSGPARRGRRRQSEEDSPVEENGDGEGLISSQEPESQQPDGGELAAGSLYASTYRDFAASGSPVSSKDPSRAGHRKTVSHAGLEPAKEAQEVDLLQENCRVPSSRPELPSAHDQENEVPLAIRVPKASMGIFSQKDIDKKPGRPFSIEPVAQVQSSAVSPERKVLGQMSQNTPHVVVPIHRPAPPPPPKMSVLETATAPAGAATTGQANKKKSIMLKVNGRSYQRVDCIGRGGSAKVYRVTAENGKMFALKRVNIENADETTVKGYKGEINLLQKLSNVDRVIQLFDYELNEEKQILSLLMEMGELDLYTLLRIRQNSEGSKLDPVFIRYYWKEMLECLSAVHAHDIVHSDLKPANFVLVQGRLKLIDFGIANAIQTDETVNVHRETQVGTPNYMSPESLMDSNQYSFTSAKGGRFPIAHGPKGPKLVKMGKPSDVWSLGCILYQMVYGQLPFAHIQNMMARYHAIINWNHPIDFPEKGTGGVIVPPSLVRTIKRCLNREQHLRPTCDELLAETDPFLYPAEFASDLPGFANALPMTEELLGRIIQSVVTRCRERLPTDGEAMSAWPAAYWASVRKAVSVKDGRS